jgi:RHS repeat-associated protein
MGFDDRSNVQPIFSGPQATGTAPASEVPLPQVSLPMGGGAIQGLGEKFSTNPMTGTSALSVPLPLSASRSGFGPSLSIDYDSGSGNGIFGVGWSLSLPAVTRKTDKGLPQYRDSDESDVFILSGSEDLVPVLRQSEHGKWERAEFEREGFVVRPYRPRVEGLFARIERWTNMRDGEMHWRAITKANALTIYGDSPATRVSDPEHPWRVFKWLISSSYDERGNAIRYEYAVEDLRGVDLERPCENRRTPPCNRYPKRIWYGNREPLRYGDPEPGPTQWMFELVFDFGNEGWSPSRSTDGDYYVELADVSPAREWPAREDAFSSFRSTFEIRTYRLCRRTLMFHRFPDELGVCRYLVRSTEFEYQDKAAGAFLVRIEQSGYKRLRESVYLRKSIPPLDLRYSESPLEAERPGPFKVNDAETANLPEGVDGGRYRWADLYGEGIAGVLSEQGGGWYFKRNLGGGRFTAEALIAGKPATAKLGRATQQLMDVDGDGGLDLVDLSLGTAGFYERTRIPGDAAGLEAGWGQFHPFAHQPVVDWNSGNLRFVDLTGDGIPDILITEDAVLQWCPSLLKEGFGAAVRVPAPIDEDEGPQVLFADPTQSIHLADMSGDGLSDIVRIRNGEVCYWPNLGYGKFGAKIVLDRSPWFDEPDLFDNRRIRLADTDGSGMTDILYLAGTEVHIYLNLCGNALSPRKTVRGLPHPGRHTISAIDLLGRGTTCLVWSSPLRSDELRPLRYIDLMRGTKPHLLTRILNNLGAETVIGYASSTEFYLADRAAGRPWLTALPFPVHVVKRVECFDFVSRRRCVSRTSYHHGYFDGVEREFRGFGRVDRIDSEEFESGAERLFPAAVNDDEAWRSPPTLIKTWYHTGVFLGADRVSRHLAHEYYREDGERDQIALDDTILQDGLTGEEAREACRGLKGTTLRQEIYALDGSDAQQRPYSASGSNATVRLLQPRGCNPYCVVFAHPRERVALSYERRLYPVGGALRADPRVTQGVTLEVDDYGNILKSVSIAHGRRFPDASERLTDEDHVIQATILATATENAYTNAVLQRCNYRAPELSRSRGYQLVHLGSPRNGARIFSFEEIADRLAEASDGRHDLAPDDVSAEEATGTGVYRRLIQETRIRFRSDDLDRLLPLGELEPLALPGETYSLALTSDLISKAYGDKAPEADRALRGDGGYRDLDCDGVLWTPSGRVFYSWDAADDPAAELAEARRHFFLPKRFRDPFGNVTRVRYDPHDLAVIETCDALDNVVRARLDYRVLEVWEVIDPNGNRMQGAFDALSRVAGVAVMGKSDESLGDTLEGFVSDLPERVALEHIADPLKDPDAILHGATTRFVYDLFAFDRTRHEAQPQPATVYNLTRETHVSDLAPGQRSRVQHAFSYLDGFSRPAQRKLQAEPGPIPECDVSEGNPRWIGDSWTLYNNAGLPVRVYEPFFSATHRFEFAAICGVASTNLYDPLGRVVARLNPDHTFQKTVIDPWRQEDWDVNDTVLVDPATDPDIGPLARRLPRQDYWPTWFEQRVNGELGPAEEDAARKTAAHADTPTIGLFDPLGRGFLSIAHNRVERDGAAVNTFLSTRSRLDIQGNVRVAIDALGRPFIRYDYDLRSRLIHQASADAGGRWVVGDVGDCPMLTYNSRGYRVRTEYDGLRRPTSIFVRAGESHERLAERAEYGELQPDAEARNLRGQLYRSIDEAGVATSAPFDFKGNLLRSERRLLSDDRGEVDWSKSPQLEDESFATETAYDALNRPRALTAPDRSVVRPVFNEANLVERLEVRLKGDGEFRPYVSRIEYNARGQRTAVRYGNGVESRTSYDPLTFRLVHVKTARRGGPDLQDLRYVYDPVGNVVSTADDAQQKVYFRNRVVGASSGYVYDAIYRLIEADGREHASTPGRPQTSDFDAGRTHLLSPGDGHAMHRYRERYRYDAVGNILELIHTAPDQGSWHRRYEYDEISVNNHLTRTKVGEAREHYAYDLDGNLIRMPHLHVMEWDFRDQLASTSAQVTHAETAETTFYRYESAGARVRKTHADSHGRRRHERIYLGVFELYREYDRDGVRHERTTLNVGVDDRRFVLIEASAEETTIRYQFDNLIGSVGLELDEHGAIISYEEYYPFGGTSYQAGRSVVEVKCKRYRYTGKERDEESGLYYYGARYYASWLGRWTSCDPAGFVDGPNLFAYVLNNPVGANDPYGTQAADEPKEEFYADGTDPETGAYESYSVTPDLETNEYVEFEPDTITVSPEKTNASPPGHTDAESPQIFFESEPFDGDALMAQVNEALQQTETPDYKAAVGMAMAEQARQAEFEKEMKDEAELEKELPGLGGSLIPFYGNGKSFKVHFKHGNYGRATFYAVMTISDVFMVKSLWAGIGKAGVRAAGTALATRIGRGGGAELAEEGLISFGQKRIAPTFRLYSEASESIRGRSLVEVAEGLKAGNISPNELPVSYFVHEGKKIAVNNRGLAALRMAGMEPTIATRVPATTELLERLAERPIDSFHRIPGLRIAVTNEKSGAGHLYTVITR